MFTALMYMVIYIGNWSTWIILGDEVVEAYVYKEPIVVRRRD